MPSSAKVAHVVRDATAMEDLVSTIEEGDAQAVRDALGRKGSSDANVFCDDLTVKHPKNRPIHIAAELGFSDIVEILLEHGASADSQNYDQRTPCHMASHFGHVNVLTVLFRWNVDLSRENKFCNQPLHEAVFNGHGDTVEALIKAGADVNAKGNHFWTPLHLSCMSSHSNSRVCEILTRAGADIFATGDLLGYTPLHWAAAKNNGDRISAILNNISSSAANQILCQRTASGDTLLDVAKTAKATESSRILSSYGNSNNQDQDNQCKHSPGKVPSHEVDETKPHQSRTEVTPIDAHSGSTTHANDLNGSSSNPQQMFQNSKSKEAGSSMSSKNSQQEKNADTSQNCNGSHTNVHTDSPSTQHLAEDTSECKTVEAPPSSSSKDDPVAEGEVKVDTSSKPKKKKTARGSLIKERMKNFLKKEDTTNWNPTPRRRRPSSRSSSKDRAHNASSSNVRPNIVDNPRTETKISNDELDRIEENLESATPNVDTVCKLISVIRQQNRQIQALQEKRSSGQ